MKKANCKNYIVYKIIFSLLVSFSVGISSAQQHILKGDSNQIWGCQDHFTLTIYSKFDSTSVLVVETATQKEVKNFCKKVYKTTVFGIDFRAFIDKYRSSKFLIRDYCSDVQIDFDETEPDRYYLKKGTIRIKKSKNNDTSFYKITFIKCVFLNKETNRTLTVLRYLGRINTKNIVHDRYN